jgi:hypothetical protein
MRSLRIRFVLLTAVTFFFALGVALVWLFFYLPVPQSKLNQLKVGMSKKEVVAVVGIPPGEQITLDSWVYYNKFSKKIVNVWFGKDGLLDSWDIDN